MLTSERRAAILLATLLFACVTFLRLGASQNPSLGPQAAIRFANQPYGFVIDPETPAYFLTWSTGDGQAFMSIAADLNGDGVSSGLGLQSYRMSRIGPSVLARLLSLGRVSLLPYGLAAASFVAYGGLLLVAVRLTDRLGLRAMLLGASPAAIIGTVFDSSEAMGSLLLTIGLTASSSYVAATAGALLGVTRPSYGTAILPSRAGLAVPIATIAAGISFQLLLATIFNIPYTGSGGNIAIPFTGYLEALPSMGPVVAASAAVVLLMAAALLLNAFDRRYVAWFRVSAAVSALLAASVGRSTFIGPMSPLRVSGALMVLLVLSPLFRKTVLPVRVDRASGATCIPHDAEASG